MTNAGAPGRSPGQHRADRGRGRGELAPGADLDMLVEMAYGVLWYRALISHALHDAGAARRLAANILSAGGAAHSAALSAAR